MHCAFLLAIDLFLLITANVIVFFLSVGLHPETFAETLAYCALTVATAVPVLLASGLNRTVWRFTTLHDCSRVVVAVAMTTAITAAVAGVLSYFHGASQFLIALQFLVMTAALVGIRALARLRHAGRCRRRANRTTSEREDILVVGVNAVTGLFLRCVTESGGSNIAVAGILSENRRHQRRRLGSHAVLGRPGDIVKIVHELDIHGVKVNRVILAQSFDNLSRSAQDAILKAKTELNIRVDTLNERLSFDTSAMPSPNSTIRKRNDIASASAAKLAAPTTYLRCKRIFDIAAGTLIGICVAPVMLLVGVLVFFDIGRPIIFWQQRPGALGRPIRILKFRTMRAARRADGQLLPDTQRLSPIGKFLRRMRLDELPQVYNVVIGEMSMVGPRPLLPIDQSQQFRGRLDVKPGLTGWAQINGGRHLSVDDKAVLDLWYARHASLLLDLRILLSTARTVLFGERIDQTAIREAWLALGDTSKGAAAERQSDFSARKQTLRWPAAVGIQPQPTSAESAQPQ